MNFVWKIKQLFHRGGQRTQNLVKNIFVTLGLRASSIVVLLMLIPLSIDYVNKEQYGIWLSVFTIVSWMGFFDFGLGLGFRNAFARARAQGDDSLAVQYVSTTYAFLLLAAAVVFALFLLGSYLAMDVWQVVSWTRWLKLSPDYESELRQMFTMLAGFTCINLVANLFSMLATANQQPRHGGYVTAIGQVLTLVAVFACKHAGVEGSLGLLAGLLAGIPCATMVLGSVVAYAGTSYRRYRPHLSAVRPHLLGDIMGKGVAFFAIQLCQIGTFGVINLVITRELGAASVTQYEVTNKYFNIVYLVALIVVSPFWSAFTDAYTKRDFAWMKTMQRRLNKMVLGAAALGVAMFCLSDFAFRLWMGNADLHSYGLCASMWALMVCQTYGAVYMFLINGIGAVRIQLILYVLCAVVAFPLLTIVAGDFGLVYVALVPAGFYLLQAVFCNVQLSKILSNSATGLWIR